MPPAEIAAQGESTEIELASRIRDRVIGYAQSDPAGGSLWVLSYDNSVLMLIERLMPAHPNMHVRHLADLIRSRSLERREQRPLPFVQMAGAGASPADDGRDALPLEEAIELAKQVLNVGGHVSRETALPQKDLRIRMELRDNRAKKRLGDSRSVSLITDIVKNGLDNGWIERFNRVPEKSGTEAIYLSASQNGSGPVLAPAQVVPAVETTAPARRKFPTRATEFEQTLQKSRIGSIPETRELMFGAIESFIQETDDGCPKPMLLLDLFSEAAQRAQHKADEIGYVAEKNWPIAARCIRRLMLWSGVLIGEDGKVVQDKIGCNTAKVAKLAPDFRRICEGFMTLYIIAAAGSISYDDDPYYLGMTLYRRGLEKAVPADELKVKADQILSHLDEQNKIEMDGNRQIRVKQAVRPA